MDKDKIMQLQEIIKEYLTSFYSETEILIAVGEQLTDCLKEYKDAQIVTAVTDFKNTNKLRNYMIDNIVKGNYQPKDMKYVKDTIKKQNRILTKNLCFLSEYQI